jgi:hypothetical protein
VLQWDKTNIEPVLAHIFLIQNLFRSVSRTGNSIVVEKAVEQWQNTRPILPTGGTEREKRKCQKKVLKHILREIVSNIFEIGRCDVKQS